MSYIYPQSSIPEQPFRGVTINPYYIDRPLIRKYASKRYKGCVCFDLDGAIVPMNYRHHRAFYEKVHAKLNVLIGQLIDAGYLFAIVTNSERRVNSQQTKEELSAFTSFNKQVVDGKRGVIFFSRANGHEPDDQNWIESSTIVDETIGYRVKRYNDRNREGSTYKTAAMIELSKNFNIHPSNIVLMDDIPEWMCATSSGVGCGEYRGYVVPKKKTTNHSYIDVDDLEKAVQLIS